MEAGNGSQPHASRRLASTAFVAVPLWIMPLGAHAIVTYAAIRSYADASGECWPSLEQITTRAGVSQSSVQRAVAKLEKAGALRRERERRPDGTLGRFVYFVALDPPQSIQRSQGPVAPVVTGTPSPVVTGTTHDLEPRRATRTTKEEASASSADGSKALRDELWEALAGAVGWRPEPGDVAAARRFGKTQRHLVAVGATAAEVARRAGHYRRAMPTCELTPEALVKHWSAIAEDPSEKDVRAILAAAEARHG
jgi:DNA-binding transcriptional ArsR family regulator